MKETENKDGPNLLVVAHAGVNRAILCRLLGMPLDRVFELAQDSCCLNVMTFGPGGARLTLFNSQPPLSEPKRPPIPAGTR